MVIEGLADVQGTKVRLEECQPNNEYLFGADLGELAKAIRNEAQFMGKSFSGKHSFFPKKRSNEGQRGQGQPDRGKSPSSRGKKAFKKRN